MRGLLDVSLLLALFDSNHVSHTAARRWLEANIQHGWASCALTQNGFVRLVSQPRYPNRITPAAAIRRLSAACASGHHLFRACDVSLVDPEQIAASSVLGPNQVTDLYLLALAVRHDDRLVTLDRRITIHAVPGATEQHLVIV